MLPGGATCSRSAPKTVGVTMVTPKYKVNVNTLEHLAAKTLELNEIGVCNLNLDQRIAFDPYRRTGKRRLHPDRSAHHNTVGAGLLPLRLRRSENIHWQALEVNRRRTRL